MSPNAKAILLLLFGPGGKAHTSAPQRYLAARLGCSVRSIRRSEHSLEADGLIRINRYQEGHLSRRTLRPTEAGRAMIHTLIHESKPESTQRSSS